MEQERGYSDLFHDEEKSEKGQESDSNQSSLPRFIAVQDANTCLSVICPCCFSKTANRTSNIVGGDLIKYHKLKREAAPDYDDKKHKEILKNLYPIADSCIIPEDLRTDLWKTKLGFESRNPGEDFQKGGLYSLQFIIYFVQHEEAEFNDICTIKHFQFALVAIQVTIYFKLALDLLEGTEETLNNLRETYQVKLVNVPQFKEFLSYISNDANYVFKLLGRIVIAIKNNYRARMNNDFKGVDEKDKRNLIKSSFDKLLYSELEGKYSQISEALIA